MDQQQLPSYADVVVVGAGPAGLTCALSLAQNGLSPVIVDARPAAQVAMRATVIHPNTLEDLDLLGCADELIAAGICTDCLTWKSQKEQALGVIKFSALKSITKYPFSLIIPQHVVERVLTKKLAAAGIRIVRGKKVIAMREVVEDTHVVCELQLESGETLRTKYVVGADGAQSTIRTLAGIRYIDPHTGKIAASEGASRGSLFVLADLTLVEPLPPNVSRDEPVMILTRGGPLALIPLPDAEAEAESQTGRMFRFATVVMPGDPEPPRNPDAAYFQRIIDGRGPGSHRNDGIKPPRIARVFETSRHQAFSAVAEKFFLRAHGGCIVLVGDAGHKHSPAGGQGLNLGVCDAVRAGRDIARHFHSPVTSDVDSILETYAVRRKEIAAQVIQVAETIEKMQSTVSWWGIIVRNVALQLMLLIPAMNRAVAFRMSGLGYREKQ